MSSTSFSTGTVIASAWLNDVNALVWTVFNGLAVTPASGKTIRSNGTNLVASTFTIADTFAQNAIPFASAANTLTALTSTASRVFTTDGTGLPGWNTALPNGTTATTQAALDNSTKVATTAYADSASTAVAMPTGAVLPFAGSAAPTGYVLCDGSAINRTTFAALFAVIGTTYGAGDGSTTFNVPNMLGRVPVGAGSGTTTETITNVTAAANAVTVGSNATKWVTGMPVTVSGASGFTGLVNGSFWIVRVDSTHISIANSLANAQNGTVVAVTGTGSATFTYNLTARSRGEVGGEEAHAMSITELLAHTHSGAAVVSGSGIAGGASSTQTGAIGTTGGNAAMNIMQPYLGVNYIIKT